MSFVRRSLSVALCLAVFGGSPALADYTLQTLVSFDHTNGNSYRPQAGLIADASGNLYGTTEFGGANAKGTVFEIAAGTHVLTTLHLFTGADGAYPNASLIADASGNLYGTTGDDGTAYNDHGTVFEIAAGTHVLTTLHSFTGADGAYPYAGLIADASGNLYGTTEYGGAGTPEYPGALGYGTVFEIAAGTHALTTLHSFTYADGSNPHSGLIADASGNLYGTTVSGGANGDGTVFEIAAGTHALTTLHTFTGIGADGKEPYAGLIADASGNLYGTTAYGGANGDGTVFEIAAGTHALTTLHSFTYANGLEPTGVIADASGNLYGTTITGGANNDGTVFEIAAGTHALTTLHSFTGADGSTPEAGVIADASGNLYGTTISGGANNDGTVFELSPSSTASVGVGTNQGAVAGGAGFVTGGVTATFDNVTVAGTLESDFQNVTSGEQLLSLIGADAANKIHFALGALNNDVFDVQLWDLSFTGSFTGEVTIVLHFDPAYFSGVPLSSLIVEHYTGGQWVLPPNQIIDPIADTITFQTDSFSPFIISSSVPEPSSMLLAAFGVAALVYPGIKRLRQRAK